MKNFDRLSVDNAVFERYGTFGVDYESEREMAEVQIKKRLETLLIQGIRDVVLDMSFYSSSIRKQYRRMD